MSENTARENQEAGDDLSGGTSTDGRVCRAARLTAELAEECATKMFTERADGPHASSVDLISIDPTIEEIVIAQAAVLGAIGEKGSKKRAHANSLCADGLIDLEQGLGYLLCDRFSGVMPTPLEARGVGKRAADKPPGKKERDRWKEKAKAARQAARKAGATEEAVAAAGQAARVKAEAAFMEVEVTISGLQRPARWSVLEPPSAAPEPEPPAPQTAPLCERGQRIMQIQKMLHSPEAARVIEASYQYYFVDDPDRTIEELQEVALVQYKHALRALCAQYPGFNVDSWPEDDPSYMQEACMKWRELGQPIPADLCSRRTAAMRQRVIDGACVSDTDSDPGSHEDEECQPVVEPGVLV